VTDTNHDHRTLDWAVDIIGMCEPIRCHQGGMWFGRNNNFADATFVDYGAADAFAVAAKALPDLVSALEDARSFMVEMRARHGDSGVGILIMAADKALALSPSHSPVTKADQP
jgi:hypothetical protein